MQCLSSFQKRNLSVSTYRKVQSEWMSENTDNALQSVPNEADVVVIGKASHCGKTRNSLTSVVWELRKFSLIKKYFVKATL